MTNAHDQSVQTLIQCLHDWMASLGGIAWIIIVFCWLAAPVMLFLFFRWVRRGGLKYQSTSQFFRKQQTSEQFCRNLIDRE